MANSREAIKIFSNPQVYLIPSLRDSRPRIGVVCDNPKDMHFQESALLMQEHCRATKPLVHEEWDGSSATQEGIPAEVQDLAMLLQALDDTTYSMWNFAVCTVSEGPFEGTRAVAIGSNAKKRARAGNLAVALTVACHATGPYSETLGSLFPALVPVLREALNPPWPGRPQVDDTWQSMQNGAQPASPPPLMFAPPPPPPPPPPLAFPTTNTPAVISLANMDTPKRHVSQARTRASSVGSDNSEDVVFSGFGSLTNNEPFRPQSHTAVSAAAAWLGPDTSILACLTHEGDDREDHHQEKTTPLKPDHTFVVTTQTNEDDEGIFHLQYSLSSKSAEDALTIATFDSNDTIPLGTDLDPNAYNNTWAAGKIADAHGKVLFTHNISKRILDAENLGYTYGQRVHQKDKCFDITGVKKAVEYFLKDGVHVVIVGKRASMCKEFQSEVASGRCEVLIADDSDDVFILKMGFENMCPIVSRDYFRKQLADLRIDPKLRRWCTNVGSKIQVKFAFDKQGTFIPDYDHQMPVLRPLRSQRQQAGRMQRGQ